MKRFFLLLFLGLSFGTKAFSQVVSQAASQPVYNESQYTQVSQGFDPEFGGKLFTVTYKNTQDSTYTMKMLYRGSATTPLVEKRFYRAGVLDGPLSHYEEGTLSLKATYTNGKLDGDRLTYQGGTVVQEAHYLGGRKAGAWKEYNAQGQLQRTVTYDTQENVQSIQIASQTVAPATPSTPATPTTQQGKINQ